MAFIPPKTFAVNEILTAVDLNVFLRDNTNALNTGFRLLNRRLFKEAGSFTFSKADPMGDGSVDGSIIRAYRIICVGGGGAGGGGKTTGAGQCSPASGGCSGTYAERFALSSIYPASIPVVVGAAGVASAGNTGGAGGASTFASGTPAGTVSAPGGNGGFVFVNVTAPPSVSQAPFLPTTGFAGDITSAGEVGQGSLVIVRDGSPAAMGGNGGSGIFGSGGSGQDSSTGISVSNAAGFGGGGGGRSVAAASTTAVAGGSGSGGLVVVELYA
jgi:hypothetical protein